jgi:hypothetical protein
VIGDGEEGLSFDGRVAEELEGPLVDGSPVQDQLEFVAKAMDSVESLKFVQRYPFLACAVECFYFLSALSCTANTR